MGRDSAFFTSDSSGRAGSKNLNLELQLLSGVFEKSWSRAEQSGEESGGWKIWQMVTLPFCRNIRVWEMEQLHVRFYLWGGTIFIFFPLLSNFEVEYFLFFFLTLE